MVPLRRNSGGTLLCNQAVSEQLEIEQRLKRAEKINLLEFKVQEKIYETMTSIVNDLKGEKNINLLKSEILYREAEKSVNYQINKYFFELSKWAEMNHEFLL